MWVFLSMYVWHHKHAVPVEARKGRLIPQNWGYGWLQARIWALRIQMFNELLRAVEMVAKPDDLELITRTHVVKGEE